MACRTKFSLKSHRAKTTFELFSSKTPTVSCIHTPLLRNLEKFVTQNSLKNERYTFNFVSVLNSAPVTKTEHFRIHLFSWDCCWQERARALLRVRVFAHLWLALVRKFISVEGVALFISRKKGAVFYLLPMKYPTRQSNFGKLFLRKN